MKITLHLNEAKDLTRFKITGSLNFVELLVAVDDFYDRRSTAHVLLDLLESTDTELNSEHAKRLAEYYPRYESDRETGKVAIAAKEDELLGLARTFKLQSDLKGTPYPIMVFRNLDDAYQWLDEP